VNAVHYSYSLRLILPTNRLVGITVSIEGMAVHHKAALGDNLLICHDVVFLVFVSFCYHKCKPPPDTLQIFSTNPANFSTNAGILSTNDFRGWLYSRKYKFLQVDIHPQNPAIGRNYLIRVGGGVTFATMKHIGLFEGIGGFSLPARW
jgi:hypothetical protein